MWTRIIFKTLGLTGILTGLFWAHGNKHDPFMLCVAVMLLAASAFTIIFADEVL